MLYTMFQCNMFFINVTSFTRIPNSMRSSHKPSVLTESQGFTFLQLTDAMHHCIPIFYRHELRVRIIQRVLTLYSPVTILCRARFKTNPLHFFLAVSIQFSQKRSIISPYNMQPLVVQTELHRSPCEVRN